MGDIIPHFKKSSLIPHLKPGVEGLGVQRREVLAAVGSLSVKVLVWSRV